MSPDYYEWQVTGNSRSRGTGYGERARIHARNALKAFKGSVLEVGCNDGYAMEVFRDVGRKVKGIDLNPELVEEARKHGLDAECLDMHALGARDWKFDNVFCSHTLEHAHDPRRVMNGMCKVAREHIYITVPREKRPEEGSAHFCAFPNVESIMTIVPKGWSLAVARITDQEIIAVLKRNGTESGKASG